VRFDLVESSERSRIALEKIGESFEVRALMLEGGGRINDGMLRAGLIDEVSLLVVPGIDGRHDIAAVFGGLGPTKKAAVPLKLESVAQRENGALWIRYEVVRS
jgi:riboflavin biosynthesis pyrimidine reductase